MLQTTYLTSIRGPNGTVVAEFGVNVVATANELGHICLKISVRRGDEELAACELHRPKSVDVLEAAQVGATKWTCLAAESSEALDQGELLDRQFEHGRVTVFASENRFTMLVWVDHNVVSEFEAHVGVDIGEADTVVYNFVSGKWSAVIVPLT